MSDPTGKFIGSDSTLRHISIPLQDVTTSWDSTFNAKFDDKCIADKNTPMIFSERACAATHLKIWRMVSALLHRRPVTTKTCSTRFSACSNLFGLKNHYLQRITIHRQLESAPDNMDVLYLGAIIPRKVKGISNQRVRSRGRSFIRVKYARQLHAYVLTAKAVKIILDNLPVNAPVDNFIASLVHAGTLMAYMPERLVVTQQGGGFTNRSDTSDIRHSARI